MAQAPRTEAERKATPRPVPPKGVNFTAPRGQLRSLHHIEEMNLVQGIQKRRSNGRDYEIPDFVVDFPCPARCKSWRITKGNHCSE